jgi:hypothetical protein
MHDPERPPLDPIIKEQIDQKLYEIDQRYWRLIRNFRIPKFIPISSPVPPRRPAHFRFCLISYAQALFETEVPYYEPFRSNRNYPIWLSWLEGRISKRVQNAVEIAEREDAAATLGHHGISLPEIPEILRNRLGELTGKYIQQDAGPHPQTVPTAQPETVTAPGETPAIESLPDQLNRLMDECAMTREEVADALDVDVRQVYRHCAGETIPRRTNLLAYQRLFSERLGRAVTVTTPPKRHGKRQ